jgi:hypothetical protein
MFKTIGHQKQKDFLAKMLESQKSSQKISQSYMFAGPSEIGKKTLAIEFAKALIDTEKEFHPDIIISDASDMSVAQMRELLNTLTLSPFSANKKVAIIDNFEKASKEVSNALLKTLEEPNGSTVIILVTSNYKKVLPTIVSRSQLLHFGRLSDEEITILYPKVKNPEIFAGKIGRVARYVSDKKYAEFFDAAIDKYSQLKNTATAERLLLIKNLADMEENELAEILSIWLESEYSKKSDVISRTKNISVLVKAYDSLESNMNRKLILQKVFLELIAI